MKNNLEVSVVVESYTHSEGADIKVLKLALQAATKMVAENGQGEVLLIDTGSPEVANLLTNHFPDVVSINAVGLSYDEGKALAAATAAGKYVMYLDGDCLPKPKDWLEQHLFYLRTGDAVATGGFSRYKGGFFATVLTVMDFGFLLPARERILQCYPSNNSGFRRDVLTDVPVPEGKMRCRCYAHTQLLLRQNKPIRMVPCALVEHDLPPFFSERFRQGYDAVAACWVDPELPESSWLVLGLLAAPLFYARNIWLDWRRVFLGRRDLSFNFMQVAQALPLFPLFRLVDLAGMIWALSAGGAESSCKESQKSGVMNILTPDNE